MLRNFTKKPEEILRLRKNSAKFCRNNEKVFETSKKSLVSAFLDIMPIFGSFQL